MNYIQGGTFGNPNYQGAQTNQNYGFNQDNRPPIPFTATNVNRKQIINIRNYCKRSETGWIVKEKFTANENLTYQSSRLSSNFRYPALFDSV